MGEYTISSLLLFNTFAVYIYYIGNTEAQTRPRPWPSSASSLTWGAMIVPLLPAAVAVGVASGSRRPMRR